MIAGIDGCKAGWLAIVERTEARGLEVLIFRTPADAVAALSDARIVAVDIPIGLTNDGSRLCDLRARRLLGLRRSSVFPAPIRPTLRARTREEADRIGRESDGRGVGAQSWGILPKVRDWDMAIRERGAKTARILEVHPEVCFWALNGGAPMALSKKDPDGYVARKDLLAAVFGIDAVSEARRQVARSDASADDVLDALVALWTARRIRAGSARKIPDTPEIDPFGLSMAIWY